MSRTDGSAPGNRMRFQDVKPYNAPAQLDELQGPASGLVQPPPWVYWVPKPLVNLDVEGEAILAYQAANREGHTVDQVQILNRDRLVATWPKLRMTPRVRQLSEGRFSGLRAQA